MAGVREPSRIPRPPRTRPAALRRAFRRDFARRAKTFRHLAAKHPLTVDDVHDLRVTTRRLRASIALLRHAGVDAKTSRARSGLRALGRLLGECRMLDVAIEDAERYGVTSPGLALRRNRSYAALRRALAAHRVSALVARLDDIGKAIPTARFEKLVTRLERFERRAERRLARPPGSPRTRHALRIEMKKTRYVIEAFGRESSAMRRLQDALGREHDLVVLRSMVGRIPRAARDERAAAARADRAVATALRSARRQLRAIRAGLEG